MRQFKVCFWLNNKRMETVIQAGDRYQVRMMIKAQFLGATNIFIQEIIIN